LRPGWRVSGACSGAGGNYAAQLAVAMGEEPAADCYSDAAQDWQLAADDQGGEDHEGEAAQH
jgi:hypothetical protein